MTATARGGAPELISVNVGLPVEASWRGRTVVSGIFKRPVEGAVVVGESGLEGDGQADPSVHGGGLKAVYVYPAEHYERWKSVLAGAIDPWGMFGENLTTRGLSERTMAIGDRIDIGAAAFIVTQPRLPCHKLEMRFDRPGMAGEFLESGLTGFYLTVVRGGTIRAGDSVTVAPTGPERVTIAEVVRAETDRTMRADLMRRLERVAGLPDGLRARYARWAGL